MFDLINQAGFFLLKSLAEFLSILLLMRFFMQLFRVSFSNQIGTFVVQLTNWAVLPLRKVVPGVFGLDLSSLLPAYLLQVIVLFAAVALQAGPDLPFALILIGGLRALLRTSIYLLIGLLILQVLRTAGADASSAKGFSFAPAVTMATQVAGFGSTIFLVLAKHAGDDGDDAEEGRSDEGVIPAVVRYEVSRDNWREDTADIAPEVHPSGYGTGKFTAHADNAGPGSTHGQTERT
mgnify:CR=1 FL=1